MAGKSTARQRRRGEVEALPSGSFRVRVYAGLDPLLGKRHYLVETVPAGPRAANDAEKVRTRLLAEVDERRNPRTKATVNQLLERYLGVLEIEDTTRNGYEGMIRLYIRPLLGDIPLGRIDGETLDAFYSELRRCRARCEHGKGGADRTAGNGSRFSQLQLRREHRAGAEISTQDEPSQIICDGSVGASWRHGSLQSIGMYHRSSLAFSLSNSACVSTPASRSLASLINSSATEFFAIGVVGLDPGTRRLNWGCARNQASIFSEAP